MQKPQQDFLESLINAPSPSGFEWPAQKVFRDYVKGYAEEIKTDVMGSVIATKNPKGNPRVMLAGHIDEIGLMIHYIDDEGYLYFQQIGGVDPAVLPGTRVNVQTKKGPIPGVIGRKAIHLLDAEERKKGIKLEELWIDIGAESKKAAEKLVKIGDAATVSYTFQKLEGDLATARAFDDKVGVFVIAEVLRLLEKKKIAAAVFSTATSQEEVGLRGARTSAFDVDAEVAIAIDVTHGAIPGISKQKHGDIKLGLGPVITRGANVTPKVEELLFKAAEKNKIPYQVEASGGGTGTDANIIQMTRSGVATALVSIPLRYMHTPSEVVSLADIENTAKLIAAFCEELNPGINWIP